MKMNYKKKVFVAALAVLAGTAVFGNAGSVYAAVPTDTLVKASQMKAASISDLTNDTRVFKLDKFIEAKNVRFQNH